MKLNATTITDDDLELMAARVRLAYESINIGQIRDARDILKKIRQQLPEPGPKALGRVVVEVARD